MRVFCPTCQEPVTIADDLAGKATFCPLCKAAFTAPALFSSAPPTPASTPAANPPAPPPGPIPSLSLDPEPKPVPAPVSVPRGSRDGACAAAANTHGAANRLHADLRFLVRTRNHSVVGAGVSWHRRDSHVL